MATKYRISSSWRNISNLYVKANNVWKKTELIYLKMDGSWKLIEGADPNQIYYFWPIIKNAEQYNGTYSEHASVDGILTFEPHYDSIANEDKPSDCTQGLSIANGTKIKVSFLYPPSHGFSDKAVYIKFPSGYSYRINNANTIKTGIYTLQFTGSAFNIV